MTGGLTPARRDDGRVELRPGCAWRNSLQSRDKRRVYVFWHRELFVFRLRQTAWPVNRGSFNKFFSDWDEDALMGKNDTLQLQISLICLLLFLNGMTVLAQHPEWFQ